MLFAHVSIIPHERVCATPPPPLSSVRFVLLLILIREGIAVEVPPGFRFYVVELLFFFSLTPPSIHPSCSFLSGDRRSLEVFVSFSMHQCGEFGFALHTKSHGAKYLPLGSAE